MSDPEVVIPEFGGPAQKQVQADDEPKVVMPEFGPPQKGGVRNQLRQQARKDNQATLARLRGLTFGLSDRAIAGVKSLVGDRTYEQELGELQAERDAYRSESPVGAFANEFIGGIATGAPVASGLKKLVGKVAPGLGQYARQAGILPAATRAAAPLAEGALYGEVAAQAEKPYGKVGTNMGQGALYGAGAAGALGLAAKGAGVVGRATAKVGQRAALAAGLAKPEKFAEKKLLSALHDENMTPEEVLDAAKFLRGDDVQLQGPSLPGQELPDLRTPVRIADVLPRQARNVVKKGVRASERAQAELSELVSNRNAEQGMRLQSHVESTLSDDVDSSAALQRLAEERAQKAGPHYEQAYALGTVRDPIVDTWIKDRKVNAKLFQELKKSLDENASKGMGEGKPMKAVLTVNKKGEMEWTVRPTIEDLDTIKKHLDSKIGELWDPVQMRYRKPKKLGESDADQLKNTRDDLIKMIDQLTPDGQGGSHYANARKSFADDSELLDAQRDGMAIVRTRPEDVARLFDKYEHRPELQQQFRAGVAASIKDLLDKADTNGGAAIVRKLWGTPGMQKKLEYVMANPSTEQTFRRNMAAEKAFIDTQKDLVPKGGGGDLLADAEGFSLPLAAANALSGRFGSAANHLGRFASGAVSGVVPEVGDDLARIAMMTPEQFEEWVAARAARQKTPGAKAKRLLKKGAKFAGTGARVSATGLAGKVPPYTEAQEEENGIYLDE